MHDSAGFTPPQSSDEATRGSRVAEWFATRAGIYRWAKSNMRKSFPDHWSLLVGEICLYSFLLLVMTGLYLSFFFRPSMHTAIYNGSYVPLQGVRVSDAYRSTVHISLDVRGGLLMRQMHHWAALILVAGVIVHMMAKFFGGVFRKPREFNWVIGFLILPLAMFEGLTGYDLPDDLLSGTGTRVVQGGLLSTPLVGTYLSMFLFGGEFPGTDYVTRFNTIHVLVLPGIMTALIVVHLMLVFYHRPMQYAGPGRTARNVVGLPTLWVRTAKSAGYFFLFSGVLALMSAVAQINPVWVYGPYDAGQALAGSQPDWYMGFADGLMRIMLGWEINLWGHTLVLGVFIPLVAFGAVLGIIGIYPFFESWITGDKTAHHLMDRPRNHPVRTGLGVAWISLYFLLLVSSSNDIIATHFHLSVNEVTWAFRVAFFVLPPLAFSAAKRAAIGLQRRDREQVLHGRETGTINRLPYGEYAEVHEQLTQERLHTLTAHDQPLPLDVPPDSSETAGGRLRFLRPVRVRLSRWMYGERNRIAKPTAEEYWATHPALRPKEKEDVE